MPLLRRLTADQKRSFGHWAMELIVVVAGVLIALWLQQWAEQRRARQNLLAAEEAIHDEVRGALTSLIWREAISQCHLDRANRIKAGLTGGSERWPGLNENTLLARQPGGRFATLLVVPSVYQRPVDTFTVSAWNSALATGALEPMERKRFGRLVAVYDQIQLLRETREREDRAAARLTALAFPMQLTPQIRFELLQALYDIDRSRFTFSAFGVRPFVEQMRRLGWNDKVEIDRWIAEDSADDRKNGFVWRPCVARPKNPFH
jgi:hypothetical protein